jgi:hypothetical protein
VWAAYKRRQAGRKEEAGRQGGRGGWVTGGLVKKVRNRREGVTSGLLRQDTAIRAVAVAGRQAGAGRIQEAGCRLS